MKKLFNLASQLAKPALLAASLLVALSSYAVSIPNAPLNVQTPAKPMIMMALGRDHRMFYEAYNDSSDIDGDGTLDIRFKPSITYLGLFDPNLCYSHNNKSDKTGLFTPSAPASGDLRTCDGTKWAGNWLNYVTTSRIDALRVVLYGGMRDVDSGTQTILRRAYIPQDAHSWAKEYRGPTGSQTALQINGYLINNYTPLSDPSTGQQHLFGNTTRNARTNCATLSTCSDLPPLLTILANTTNRVWEWASTERPVLSNVDGTPGGFSFNGGTITDRTVRVEVCTTAFNGGCKLYKNGNYKPVGLLHDFGETDAASFGLMTGSYDNNVSGGRLRTVMRTFTTEVRASTDGTFISGTGGIVDNLNAFRILGFNRGNTSQLYQGEVVGNRPANEGEFPDWGNPFGELIYEAVRYIANKGVATGAFTSAGTTLDDLMGLSKPTWDHPYKEGSKTSTAQAPVCSRATLLGISDTNISFDSNQLPGVNPTFGTGITTDLSGRHIRNGTTSNLNVSAVAGLISANEPSISGNKFIGQSGAITDGTPSPKAVTSLANIRGLAPEEPTKQGSYYSASVSNFAKINDLNSNLAGDQAVDSYFIALASPLPRIEARLPNGRVLTMLPFAKSVGGAFDISNAKNTYQPTNQIVDFYVESIANSGPADTNAAINGGRYEAIFRVNFEDVEQGNDHDMDAIAVYTIRAKADNTLDVSVRVIYQAGGVKHRIGYILSGSTQDGIYLVTQDESENNLPYYLSVPPGRAPGYCDIGNTTNTADYVNATKSDCLRLPFLNGSNSVATLGSAAATAAISQFTFSPSTTPAATFLKDPMWYAAKWGGFKEITQNSQPELEKEWDADGDGQPDTYFFVQNPTKLKTSLRDAFNKIIENNSSSSSLAVNNSTGIDSNSFAYRASYTSSKWVGELEAYPVTIAGISPSASWRASEKMPVWTNRQIFLHNSDGIVSDLRSTSSFGSLPVADQTSLGSNDVLEYIRGNQAKEVINGGTLRSRVSLLGDIIHSAPAYDPITDTIFIGANDGKLHAFNGTTGVEKFSFIPRQMIPRLKNPSNVAYENNHEYFVDGFTMRSGRFALTDRKSYVYSLLGRGGKGLFSIDPSISSTTATIFVPKLLWEYTPIASTAAAADKDLGFMLSTPVMMKFNNNMMGIVVGNGYNSTDQKAVLYVFLINRDGSLFKVQKISTNLGGDNGLSGPVAYDTDGNGTADFIYAGDLKGNVWKFDVSDFDPNNWKLAYTGNKPFFTAVDASGNPQPITAPMSAEYNSYGTDANVNNLFLFVGTGSYFQSGDNTSVAVQSMYGLVENKASEISATSPVTRTNLRQRTITSYGSIGGQVVRYISSSAANDTAGLRGWYIDLNNPVNGERVFTEAKIAPVNRPVLLFTSSHPVTDDVCTPGGFSYLNAVNPFTGAAVDNDANGNGIFKDRGTASSLKFKGIATQAVFTGNQVTDRNITSSLQDALIKDFDQSCTVGCSPECTANCRRDIQDYQDKVVGPGTQGKPGCLKDSSANINSSEAQADGSLIASAPFNPDCAVASVRGRISWREIIRD
jgi:type IV pilus assembly protein PilY1